MLDTSPTTTIKIERIRHEPEAWPRRSLDRERVEEFALLFAEEGFGRLPPLVVVPDGEGDFILADGHHRLAALGSLGVLWVFAQVVDSPDDPGVLGHRVDPLAFAYELALSLSSASAKPLTQAERRHAVARLVEERHDLSDRAIARLVGVSPSTVGNLRGVQSRQPQVPKTVGPDTVAARIVRDALCLLSDLGDATEILADELGRYGDAAQIALEIADLFEGSHAIVSERSSPNWAGA